MGKRGRHYQMEMAIAKDTPDEISQEFDLNRQNFRQSLHEWLLKYQKLMRMKHGSDVVVDLTHEQPYPSIPSIKLITAFVKTETGNTTP